jgi:hypothetical protein
MWRINMEKLTLGEFRKFTEDLPDDYEIRVCSIQRGERSYHTEVDNISSSMDTEGNYVILEPNEIEVSEAEYEED